MEQKPRDYAPLSWELIKMAAAIGNDSGDWTRRLAGRRESVKLVTREIGRLVHWRVASQLPVSLPLVCPVPLPRLPLPYPAIPPYTREPVARFNMELLRVKQMQHHQK